MNRVLIIEDEPTSAIILKEHLSANNPNIEIAETGYEALEAIQSEAPDLILLDLGLPDINGLDLIGDIQKISSHSEIIVVTGEKSADSAIRAIHLGARDYLIKPIDKERLYISVQNAFDRIELSRQLAELKNNEQSSYNGIIGKSHNIRDVFKTIDTLSQCEDTVLITGEHGSGKTLCARTIHDNGTRADNPFSKINCSTLQGSRGGAELNTAFSDCERGTLYLSNITEMCPQTQNELFKFLDAPVDVRLICSSSQSTLDAVKDGAFREDLFYRINVLPIDIPPLRARGQDINLLASYFLERYSKKTDKNFKEFDDLTLQAFNDHHWPGNVRELENLIHRITTLNADSDLVTSSMLPTDLLSISQQKPSNENEIGSRTHSENLFNDSEVIAIRDLEQMAIEHALNVCDGNVQQAALKLKISPATLYRKKPG